MKYTVKNDLYSAEIELVDLELFKVYTVSELTEWQIRKNKIERELKIPPGPLRIIIHRKYSDCNVDGVGKMYSQNNIINWFADKYHITDAAWSRRNRRLISTNFRKMNTKVAITISSPKYGGGISIEKIDSLHYKEIIKYWDERWV